MPKVTLITRLGVEQDLDRSTSDFTSQMQLESTAFGLKAPSVQKTRVFASVGAQYDLKECGVISVNVNARQQSLRKANDVDYGLNTSYSFGF